jgi:hypothetical protein
VAAIEHRSTTTEWPAGDRPARGEDHNTGAAASAPKQVLSTGAPEDYLTLRDLSGEPALIDALRGHLLASSTTIPDASGAAAAALLVFRRAPSRS